MERHTPCHAGRAAPVLRALQRQVTRHRRSPASWACSAALGLALFAATAPAPAQGGAAGNAAGPKAAATKAAAPVAKSGAKVPSPVAKGSAKAKATSTVKGPVASRNVAVGAAAAPALPTAVLSQGCAGLEEQALALELAGASASAVQGGDGGEGAEAGKGVGSDQAPACVPFARVHALGPAASTLALMAHEGPESAAPLRRALVVRQAPRGSDEPLRSWMALPVLESEAWVPVSDLLAGVAAGVPARWQRELGLLVRLMRRGAEAGTWVRLVFSDASEAARPVAVELVDDQGEALDSAIWVERDDAPSGFISTRGADHERILWQSPVGHHRISRGVGWGNVFVKRRVVLPPRTAGGKSRVVVRGFRSRGQHQGVDFAAPTGTPVVTVADGTVVHAGPNGGYGNLVIVDHGGGITTYYAHLSTFGEGIEEGTRVERGQEIGQVGSTGRSTGPHLHYEIRKDGKYLDPADPKQGLPNWRLAPADEAPALLRLLALSAGRLEGLARARGTPPGATEPSQVATAPGRSER